MIIFPKKDGSPADELNLQRKPQRNMIIPFTEPEISLEIAIYLWNSVEKFPVDFELAWQWLGYTRKDSAKKKLARNFVENEDYMLRHLAESAPDKGLTHRDDIWLSCNCLKEMAMMAGTQKGKKVRQYFLECEVLAKQAVKVIPGLQQQIQQLQENFDRLQSQVQKILPPTSDSIPPGWDASTWATLPQQDKHHFRHIYQNFGFRPDDEPESSFISADVRIQQRQEMERIIGEVTPSEIWRVEDAKQELLQRFWAEGDDNEQ
jgi:phage anti-repressor protein